MAKEDQILERLIDLASDMRSVTDKLDVIERWMISKSKECEEHHRRTTKLEHKAIEDKATRDALQGQAAKLIIMTSLLCTVLTLALKLLHVI